MSRVLATLVFLLAISFGAPLGAAEAPTKAAAETATKTPPATPYSGDLWSRSTLTGDWGGLRNEWSAKGVTVDITSTQVGQGVVNGGKSEVWQYGGRNNLTINLDSQKLGLWPGGFFTLEAEVNFASSVNGDTGALMPVNNSQIFPLPPGNIFAVPAWTFTQFLSHYAGIYLGKIDTLSGDANEFAHGKGDTQFMNMALNFNPVVAFTVPYSTLGTGVVVLPTKDPNQAVINFSVMQTNGLPNVSGFNDLTADRLTFAGEGRIRTNFFGLTGHQVFGVTYSNQKYTSVDQNVRVIIQNRQLEGKSGSWNIHYNFDQYLYEPKKDSGEGIGVFGRFGAADGNPNFMNYFISLGVGGKGVIPGRKLDRYGLGFYYMFISNPTLTGVFQTTKLLRDEWGFEMFYNFAVTPWLRITPDIQVVKGAQKEKITVGAGPPPFIADRTSIGTSTVLALRWQIVF